MRVCPICHTPNPDDASVCRVDGASLEDVAPKEDEEALAPTRLTGDGVPDDLAASGERATKSGRPGRALRLGGQAEDAVGVVLGTYRLGPIIGRGGMGRVYRAEHTKLGRPVALKVLRPEYAVRREAVARFFQEAKAVNRIRHRNIVDITDFVELEDRTVFIIMELLEGASLGKLYRVGTPLSLPRLLGTMAQVCDALAAAHSVGIIHRDLKPDNIFLCDDGAGGEIAKLLDFGVAKLLGPSPADEEHDEDDEPTCQTAAGVVVGTPAYMSPEQAAGKEIGPQSDVYAIGVILYELLCGQPLFPGSSFGELVHAHMYERPTPPAETRGGKDLDPRLVALLLSCLEKDLATRPASASQIRDELLAILGSVDTGSYDGRNLPRAGGTPPPQIFTPPPSRIVPTRRRRWPFVVAGAALFALATAASVLAASSRALVLPTPTVPWPPVAAVEAPPPLPPKPVPSPTLDEIRVRFSSEPRGATVIDDDTKRVVCVTPCNHIIDVDDGGDRRSREFVYELDGRIDERVVVSLAEDGDETFHRILQNAPARPNGSRGDPTPHPPPQSDKIKPSQTLDPFGAPR